MEDLTRLSLWDRLETLQNLLFSDVDFVKPLVQNSWIDFGHPNIQEIEWARNHFRGLVEERCKEVDAVLDEITKAAKVMDEKKTKKPKARKQKGKRKCS